MNTTELIFCVFKKSFQGHAMLEKPLMHSWDREQSNWVMVWR